MLLSSYLVVSMGLGVALFAASHASGARDGQIRTAAFSSTWIASRATGQPGVATIDPFEQ